MFSIFTPCFNSEAFLHRVFESLNRQTYRNFEWIVVNDASTDNTSTLINEFIRSANFEIQFFDLPKNQMLTKNYNLAIKHARGRFFLPAGHDDEFLAETLQTFLNYWEKYGSPNISGISCLCKNQFGQLVGDFFPDSPYISNYFDIVYNKKISGEKWGFTRTEVMREFLLPEDVDVYISEAIIWASIGNAYKTIYINEVLRVYYMHSDHKSLSSLNKKRLNYPNGIRFQNLEMINKYLFRISGNFITKLFFFVNYIRMSLHLGMDLVKMSKEILTVKHKIIVFFMFPFGLLIAKKDKMQNRI